MNLLRVTGKSDVVALTPDVSVVPMLALVVSVLLLSLGLLGRPPPPDDVSFHKFQRTKGHHPIRVMALLLFEGLWSSENSKVFVTVATEHSFSRAAIKLCRTQPAVSQAVRRLERELGEPLFDRTTKSAKLTQAGDALLPRSDPIAANGRRSSGHGPPVVAAGPGAVVRIGGDEPDAHILLPALSTFLLERPHVSVEFRRVADLDVLAEVGAGTIDIGITTRERVPVPLCSVQVPVLSTGLCVLLPKSHPLASWPELPVTVLHSERLVMLAGLPVESLTMRVTDDAAAPTGVFVVMPGIDSLKHAVAERPWHRDRSSRRAFEPHLCRTGRDRPANGAGSPHAHAGVSRQRRTTNCCPDSSRPCGARERPAAREKLRSP